MGIFDFIGKLFEKEKTEIERVDFSDIGNWINKRKKDIEIREEKLFLLVKDKINVFVEELKRKIKVVENFNIESKKVEDKLKTLSDEGRKKYLELLEIFINDLNKLEKSNFEKFNKNIDKIFLDFNKSSRMNYERATILIGKEMADIKETLKIFSRDLIKIFRGNQDIIDSSKTFSVIELNLNKIVGINEELEIIGKTIVCLDKDLIEKEEENKDISKEIEDIRKSENYIQNLEMKENIKFLKEEFEKELLSLRQIIDFKALANFYHIFEDKMKLIKECQNDFQKKFEENSGENILNLLSEAKLNNEPILDKIKKIEDKKEEIKEKEGEVKNDEAQGLYLKIREMDLDINNLKNEKSRQEKREEKLNFEKEELIEGIKNEIENVGGKLVD